MSEPQHHPPSSPWELPDPRKRRESNRRPCQECSNSKVKSRCERQPNDPKCVRCAERGLPCTPYIRKPKSPKPVKRPSTSVNDSPTRPPEVLVFSPEASPRNGQPYPPPPTTRATTSTLLIGHAARSYTHSLQPQDALPFTPYASPRDIAFPFAPPLYLPAVAQSGGATYTPVAGWGEDAQAFENPPPFSAFPASRQAQAWTLPQMSQQVSGFHSEEYGLTSQNHIYPDTHSQLEAQVQPQYADSSTATFMLFPPSDNKH